MPDRPPDRVIGLYEETAGAFDRARSRSLFERPWLDRFLGLMPERPRVLDVGCGTGEPISRHLIDCGARLTGVDAAAPMVALCRSRFPEHKWLVADMRELDLGRAFDGVLAWHSLFHLTPDEQRAAIPRLAEHVKPGGALMFTSGPEHGEVLGEWEGEPLYSASLSPAEYRDLLQAKGLSVIDVRLDDEECGGATVWLAQMSPASGLDGSA